MRGQFSSAIITYVDVDADVDVAAAAAIKTIFQVVRRKVEDQVEESSASLFATTQRILFTKARWNTPIKRGSLAKAAEAKLMVIIDY